MSILDAIFGCWHQNISFPRTVRKGHRHNDASLVTGTYVVCLDCGKEFAYDWQKMRIVNKREWAGSSRFARNMSQ